MQCTGDSGKQSELSSCWREKTAAAGGRHTEVVGLVLGFVMIKVLLHTKELLETRCFFKKFL